MAQRKMNDAERFWQRVNKGEACWLWIGRRNHDGYGCFGWRGFYGRAHRFSYELHFGPIPEGAEVCHTCDNPPCVRPESGAADGSAR